MKTSEIKSPLVLKLLNHEKIAPKKQAYFLDIINTLNPANNLFISKSTAKKSGSVNHKVNINLIYKFQNQYSAKLFGAIFKHIVLQDQFLLSVKASKNFVLIKTKQPIMLQHKEKFSTQFETIKHMERSFSLREETFFLSEIFINTVKAIFFSDVYQDIKDPKHIVTKEIIKQMKRSSDDRVVYSNLKLLLNYISESIKEENLEEELNDNWLLNLIKQISDYLFEIKEINEEIKFFDNKYLK